MTNPDPTTDLVARLDARGFDPRATGADAYESLCPVHRGGRRNLSIKRGDDGRALVHCHAHGCPPAEIVAALGLELTDLFPLGPDRPIRPRNNGDPKPTSPHPTPKAAIEATVRKLGQPTMQWAYHNADGTEAARVYRFDPSGERKQFRPVHRAPGGWRMGGPPGLWPPYRLPEIGDAPRVFVTEGEKCADLAAGLGLVATTSAHGAQSAHKTDWRALAGREVVILPDNDPEGERYSRTVAGELSALSPPATVRVVRLADLWKTDQSIPEGGDLAEWLECGVPDTWLPEDCLAELERVVALADEAEPGTTPSDGAKSLRVKMTRAADVATRPVEWLWLDRVPLGMLTLFAGDPKLGKSFVTIGLSANVSRGAPMPSDGRVPNGPGSVVLLSAEDDPARTIVPRLKDAGADLTRVFILEAVYLSDGAEAPPSLRTDMDAIEDAIVSAGDCRLVVIDPISAYLGGTDDQRNAELRSVLSPLKALAERHNVAVVLVTHLNKSGGTNAKYRVTGSIAYVGACRANFLFARDKDDPTGRRVFMLSNGCNLAPDPPTLAYRVEDQGGGPVVVWEDEPVAITAEDALQAEPSSCDQRDEQAACERWLHELLSSGRLAQTEVESVGKDNGFSRSQLNRAKRGIGAVTDREGFGKGSRCYWRLPESRGP